MHPRKHRGWARRLSRWARRAAAAAAALGAAGAGVRADRPRGVAGEGASRELAAEKAFDAQLNPADLRAWLERMSSEANNVGTPKDKANAEFMAAQFRSWGWDTHIETFYCLYPTPISHSLELVAPYGREVKLIEPPIPGDRTSFHTDKELPAYNIYGADGDVTGELVYVNYGMPEDYEELARHGVSVNGRIAIARYGAGWRGIKPKLAYEHGAIGCIIYSDPKDGGFYRGATYPQGSWQSPEALQRGSVMDLPVYPGDPLTPGVGATKDAKRLPLDQARTILKIPVIPISAAEAQPLLAAISGPVAPEAWRGAYPFTYRLGPGPAKVRLRIRSDWSLKPVYDVIAVMRGGEEPDQWVVRGNHHDGWTFGAYDPLSANVSMMAEAKAIGGLARTGWRPARTLIYCGWDGEEPGLLGSTEWGETHADDLQRHAVLYLNTDCYGRGWLQVLGSQQLTAMIRQIEGAIRDPETGVSMRERIRDVAQVEAFHASGAVKDFAADPPMGALGGGSDFTVFLAHLGIASLDSHPGGEFHSVGIYHTAYDSFDYYVRFVDPDFSDGIAAAQTAGRIMLRMADAAVLPMRFGDFAAAITRYDREVHALDQAARAKIEASNRLAGENAFRIAADPRDTYVPPPAQPVPPALDFAALDRAAAAVARAAAAYDAAFDAAARGGLALPPPQRARVNGLLQGIEQMLLDPQGLPGRPWHRHLIYAPGLYTGYDTKTLPGVRESIETGRWADAQAYIAKTAAALDRFTARLNEARQACSRPR